MRDFCLSALPSLRKVVQLPRNHLPVTSNRRGRTNRKGRYLRLTVHAYGVRYQLCFYVLRLNKNQDRSANEQVTTSLTVAVTHVVPEVLVVRRL